MFEIITRFIYDHALTIEGLITFIVLITIVGVMIDNWATRLNRKHMKRMQDEDNQFLGPESYKQEGTNK